MEVFLSGHLQDINGEIIQDDFFVVCVNAHHEEVSFVLPLIDLQSKWELVLDTSQETGFVKAVDEVVDKISLCARSIMLLRLKNAEGLDRSGIMEKFGKL